MWIHAFSDLCNSAVGLEVKSGNRKSSLLRRQ